jgi:hypothetical protein
MTIHKKKGMVMLTDGNLDNASARIRAIQYIPFFCFPHFFKSGSHVLDFSLYYFAVKQLNRRMLLSCYFA